MTILSVKIGMYNEILMVGGGRGNGERFEEWLARIQSNKQIRIIKILEGWGLLLYEEIDQKSIAPQQNNKSTTTRFSDIDIVSANADIVTPEEAHFIKSLLLVDMDTYPEASMSFDKQRRETLYNKICNIEKGN